VLLFFLYGARMATGEVWAGLRSWRLQGSMLAATYVAFPVLGLLVQLLPDAVISAELKTGLLYLSLLPSTVQASAVFTSVARGNVAGAITGATISNVVGIVLTPLLVGVLMVRTSGEGRISNFLLWEGVGAHLYVTPTLWPEFGAAELDAAVEWWRARTR
jgi:sodium/bile acid cotransporter 7